MKLKGTKLLNFILGGKKEIILIIEDKKRAAFENFLLLGEFSKNYLKELDETLLRDNT